MAMILGRLQKTFGLTKNLLSVTSFSYSSFIQLYTFCEACLTRGPSSSNIVPHDCSFSRGLCWAVDGFKEGLAGLRVFSASSLIWLLNAFMLALIANVE